MRACSPGGSTSDQWFRDVANVDIPIELAIDRNFHFTYELHTEFVYEGGW